ncbi:MAG: TonB-dependent receptor, partial [Woeseiaceae bacterium]
RVTEDEVSFNHNRRNNDPFGRQGVGVRNAANNSNFSNKTDESNTSGKLGAQWSTDNLGMFYLTYAQGYKGPAFNTFYNMGPNDVLPIGAEESNAFELGWKYTADTFLLNLTAFKTDVENFQANNFDNSTGVTITRLTNAGDVSTEGFEADFLWQPMENISIGGGFAAVDATIDKFNCPLDAITGLPPAGCSERSGLDVPFSPDLKVSLYGEWVVPLNTMDFVLNGSYVHTDEQYSDLPGTDGTFNPAALLPSYDILNLTASLSFNDDQFRISLIGKNLGDESYATTYSGDGFRYQIPRDASRYFGVGLRAAF